MEEILLDTIHQYPAKDYADGVEPILYCKSRIKNPDSMIHKLKKRGVATDGKTAIRETHDAVGVRIICSFIDDVYKISQWLSTQNNFTIVATKDYIAYPKPNGYRSFHMILGIQVYSMESTEYYPVEVQIRTIGMDFWASMEHRICYKQERDNKEEIQRELLRYAEILKEIEEGFEGYNEQNQNEKARLSHKTN